MKAVKMISIWLLIIGGLAWGFEGLTDKDVFEMITSSYPMLETVIDVLIGLAALFVGYKVITSKECH